MRLFSWTLWLYPSCHPFFNNTLSPNSVNQSIQTKFRNNSTSLYIEVGNFLRSPCVFCGIEMGIFSGAKKCKEQGFLEGWLWRWIRGNWEEEAMRNWKWSSWKKSDIGLCYCWRVCLGGVFLNTGYWNTELFMCCVCHLSIGKWVPRYVSCWFLTKDSNLPIIFTIWSTFAFIYPLRYKRWGLICLT